MSSQAAPWQMEKIRAIMAPFPGWRNTLRGEKMQRNAIMLLTV
ncbi:hypothetical protein [Superficieibacter electus]|nr:hypothetical protein [Superficieibacter electus]